MLSSRARFGLRWLSQRVARSPIGFKSRIDSRNRFSAFARSTSARATSISGIRTAELVRLTELNEVHSTEASTGHLLICKRSLDDVCSKRREKNVLPKTNAE